MTDRFAPGSLSRSPSGSNPWVFRRTSYASVAAGVASAAPASFSPPTRDTGHLHSQSDHSTPRQHIMQQYTRGTDAQGMYNRGSASKSGFDITGSWEYREDIGGLAAMEGPRFFIPSYLRQSRYMERLESAHKARLHMLRDARHAHYHQTGHGSLSSSSSSANLNKLSSSHGNKGPVGDVIERSPPDTADSELRMLPSKWSEVDRCAGLDILADGFEVRCGQGVAKTNDDAAAIRSDHPMPKECGIYYYEVTILSKSKEGLIGVGFSGPKAGLNRLPGWEPESWGYHGDDGFSFACTGGGKHYGPHFAAMDVVGCGVNFRTGTAFFTKNGVYLGDAFQNIKTEKLYPCVGVKKPGEHLRVNFGQSPFVYDIDAMMEKERSVVKLTINRTTHRSCFPTLDETSAIQELVAQYLAHEGYVETARNFADEVKDQRQALTKTGEIVRTLDPFDDVNAINRQKIRAAILRGDIDKALKQLNAHYPNVMNEEINRDIYFKLRCQKFIEMMRRCTEPSSVNKPHVPTQGLDSERTAGENALHGEDGYDSDVFDHQMELDDQLQRESGAKTRKTAGMPQQSPQSHAADDTMDITPDAIRPGPASPGSSKPAAIVHRNLLESAIQYGRELQLEFSNDSRKEVRKALNDTFALIAYKDARDSVLGDLMEGKGRVEIAERVNGAILVSLGKPRSALLEKLCAQTEVLVDLMSSDGGAGAFVNVQQDYLQ